jgi:hypothetical protein
MVNSVGNTGGAAVSASVSAAVGALNGRIRDDKMQLDDWATCVSAKTVKGQAEIQRLSGQISAEREEVARVQAVQAGAASQVAALPTANQPAAAYAYGARPPAVRGNFLDVWA